MAIASTIAKMIDYSVLLRRTIEVHKLRKS